MRTDTHTHPHPHPHPPTPTPTHTHTHTQTYTHTNIHTHKHTHMPFTPTPINLKFVQRFVVRRLFEGLRTFLLGLVILLDVVVRCGLPRVRVRVRVRIRVRVRVSSETWPAKRPSNQATKQPSNQATNRPTDRPTNNLAVKGFDGRRVDLQRLQPVRTAHQRNRLTVTPILKKKNCHVIVLLFFSLSWIQILNVGAMLKCRRGSAWMSV